MAKSKRICIIGAGAAGLIAISKLCHSHNSPQIICFEKNSEIGGVWNYKETSESDDVDSKTEINPIYKGLKTNLSASLMSLREFPWKIKADEQGAQNKHLPTAANAEDQSERSHKAVPEDRIFPTHSEVLKYLQDYSAHFNLSRFIAFNHSVLTAVKVDDEWIVTVLDILNGVTKTHTFDYIVIANGHFSEPFTPSVKGLKEFSGIVTHSNRYESPQKYSDRRVLVIGGSFSALDITREISYHASHLYLSVTTDPGSKELQHATNFKAVTIKTKVDKFSNDGSVQFTDGSRIENISHVIYATGYLFDYPFLSITDSSTSPVGLELYLNMYYIKDPSLVFLGLPRMVVPFHLFEYQAEHFVKLIDRVFSLPSDMTPHGINLAEWASEFEYCDQLAKDYEGEFVPKWRKCLRGCNAKSRLDAIGY